MIKDKDHSCRATSASHLATVIVLSLALPGCGGPKAILNTSPQLTQLKVTPLTSGIALGQMAQFTATAIFSDDSAKDETKAAVWTSSNSGVAKVGATGQVTSLSVGTATIHASVNGIAGSASLTVSKAVLVSLSIEPPASSIVLGTTTQLKAIAAFTDLSTQDVTDIVTWGASDPNIIAISSTGLATSRSIGKASITASAGSVNASSPFSVTAAALVSISVSQDRSAVPLGIAAQFKAQGVYSDGSMHDLTDSVTWSSSPQDAVNVNSSGLATGLKVGAATVNAKLDGIAGAGMLTVSAAQLTSIAVSSDNLKLPLGATQQMTATGSYTDASTRDLTNSVSWSSASKQIVNISNSGVAGAKGLGTTVISATTSAMSGSAMVTVSSPALVTIVISPSNPAVPLGRNLQLAAIGSFTDGSTQDLTRAVTWAVDNASVASLSSTGYATAEHVGSTGAEVIFGGIQGTATILVEPIAAVSYFTAEPNEIDTTLRITNPGSDGNNLCAMVYVFDQDQQMAECCGCQISRDGLRTFSLNKDLIGNPLTGRIPTSGSLLLVPADSVSNPSCDSSSIDPTGTAIAWATHLQASSPNSGTISEESLSEAPLSATLTSALQAQCHGVQQLGGGQGICSCGTGH